MCRISKLGQELKYLNPCLQVFAGGASEGQLQPGDRILNINTVDTELMTHFEAQHLFK